MVAEFLTWWRQQLVALLPHNFSQDAVQGRNGIVVELAPNPASPSISLINRQRGRDIPAGRFTLDETGVRALSDVLKSRKRSTPVILRLPSGTLLERQTVLPLAAEQNLQQVLGYEMDRITPFAVEDIFWTWSIERRDRARGQLHLLLSLVPKVTISVVMAALRQAEATPSVLQAASADGALRVLPLRHVAARGSRWRRQTVVALGATCAGLAISAVAIPFVQQSVAGDKTEEFMTPLRPQVQQVDILRRRIAAAEADGDVFAGQRERVGSTVGMLATLTDILPDDTHLTTLSLRARVGTLSGQSAAAARLIAALAADPAIRNPTFTAPVTRNEVGGGEGFSIRVEFTP